MLDLFKNYKKFKQIGIFFNAKELKTKIDEKNTYRSKLKQIFFGPWFQSEEESFPEYEFFSNREEEILAALKTSESIRVIEEAGRGKTRAVIESIRSLCIQENEFFKNVLLIYFHSNISKLDYSHIYRKFLIKKYKSVVLFFDDIDKFANQLSVIVQIIKRFKSISKKLKCICTCRIEQWEKTTRTEFIPCIQENQEFDLKHSNHIDWMSFKQSVMNNFRTQAKLQKLSPTEGMTIAKRINKTFNEEIFSGNISDIVLESILKKEEYHKLSNYEKIVLHTIKFLDIAHIYKPEIRIVREIASLIFNEIRIPKEEIFSQLSKTYFLKIDDSKIIIPDIYIKEVITDFPIDENQTLSSEFLYSKFLILRDYLIKESYPSELLSLAEVYITSGFDDEGLYILNQVEKMNISTSELMLIYLNRSVIFARKSKYIEAFFDFERAIEVDTKHLRIYFNRGLAYAHLRDYDSSIKDFKTLIKLDKNEFWGYYNLGVVLFKAEKFEESIKYFSSAIVLDREFKHTYFNRGTVYMQLQEYKKSIEDFEKLLHLDPLSSIAYFQLGYCYRALGEEEKSSSNFLKAIELEPKLSIRIPKFIISEINSLSRVISEIEVSAEEQTNLNKIVKISQLMKELGFEDLSQFYFLLQEEQEQDSEFYGNFVNMLTEVMKFRQNSKSLTKEDYSKFLDKIMQNFGVSDEGEKNQIKEIYSKLMKTLFENS